MKKIVLDNDQIYIGNLILVNNQHPYHDDVARHNLQSVNNRSNILLEAEAVKFLSNVMSEFNGWNKITAVSGYRSLVEQQEIYAQSIKDNGELFTKKYVASPNHSEHHTGLAIDLALKQENIDFICPDFPYSGICEKFRQISVTYGFIERYQQDKENITGIAHEPWHFRYVGVPHAEIIKKFDFALEEYIDFIKEYSPEKPFLMQNSNIYISYLKAGKSKNMTIEIDENISFDISGNNIDGFIITERRKSNAGK